MGADRVRHQLSEGSHRDPRRRIMKKLPLTSAADQSQAGEAAPDRGSPDVAIRAGVLTSLGRPPELYRVDVRPLWSNYYRVNVMVGADPTALRIAHSYFVE